MKLLQSHDYDFDVCRSFLVVSMVFTHVFEMFYIPDYNGHLTYFVTIGFIFLSGFTIGALYAERFRDNSQKAFAKLFSRGFKLLALFTACNLAIYFLKPGRFDSLIQQSITNIIITVVLGTKQSVFGFDLLVPLAITSIISGFILRLPNNRLTLFFLFIFFLFLCITESTESLNYYGIKLTTAGIIGCCLGIPTRNLDWKDITGFWSKRSMMAINGALIFIYYAVIFYLGKKLGPKKVYFHIIPTIGMIFYVYILSNKFQLSKNFLIKIPNSVLSANLLFAYLFHIFVINMIFFFIPKDSLAYLNTLFLAFFVLCFTVAACYFVEYLNAKSNISKMLYWSIFRL